jgi:hypothetical protein
MRISRTARGLTAVLLALNGLAISLDADVCIDPLTTCDAPAEEPPVVEPSAEPVPPAAPVEEPAPAELPTQPAPEPQAAAPAPAAEEAPPAPAPTPTVQPTASAISSPAPVAAVSSTRDIDPVVPAAIEPASSAAPLGMAAAALLIGGMLGVVALLVLRVLGFGATLPGRHASDG